MPYPRTCRFCGDADGEWDQMGEGVYRCCQCGQKNVIGTLDRCSYCGDTEGEWDQMGEGVYRCCQCSEHTYTVEAFQH